MGIEGLENLEINIENASSVLNALEYSIYEEVRLAFPINLVPKDVASSYEEIGDIIMGLVVKINALNEKL